VTLPTGRSEPARIAPYAVRAVIAIALVTVATALLSPVVSDAGWALAILAGVTASAWILQWAIRNTRHRSLTGLSVGVAAGLAALPGIVSLLVFDDVPASIPLSTFAVALVVYLWPGWKNPDH
jgi:hypothetical protein